MLLLLSACVLDRTGQSATAAYERELALASARADTLESSTSEVERRVGQLEEVMRYKGQQEAVRLENLEQVTDEVRRIRGKIETLEYDAGVTAQERAVLDDDVAFRLEYLELRVASLEKQLGLEPPPPPIDGAATDLRDDGEVVLVDSEDPVEVEFPAGAEELLAEAEAHLVGGRPKIARVMIEKFLRDYPEHEKATEARYRYAETHFNEEDYPRAILLFEEVVTSDPKSPWAPWAMVRQGECFQRMGQDAEATLFWQDVIARYPKTQAAKDAKELLK
ncbi:MAG TPA: tetratricopeptide repeat protein [Myxococcota bacterium]|nr:tetratricopeptide repeat protein [Myxococcota bacterium]